jgi:hypothetical protein
MEILIFPFVLVKQLKNKIFVKTMRTLLFLLSGFLVLFSTRFCAQTPEWVRTSSHAQPSFGESGSALDVDALGNSIFAGDYVFGATINGVTFLSGSTSVANCFVSTANASGAFNWVMQISGTGAKAITDAKWTSSGEVLVCGFFCRNNYSRFCHGHFCWFIGSISLTPIQLWNGVIASAFWRFAKRLCQFA